MTDNEKLAKFAGFEYYCKTYGWKFPDGSLFGNLPNFFNSMDACIKWIVPELDYIYITQEIDDDVFTVAVGIIVDKEMAGYKIEYDHHESLSTAFCNALLKLIKDNV